MMMDTDFKLEEYVNSGIPVTLIKIIEYCRLNESKKESVGLMRIINDNQLNIAENHYKRYIILAKSFKDLCSTADGIKEWQRYYGMELECQSE